MSAANTPTKASTKAMPTCGVGLGSRPECRFSGAAELTREDRTALGQLMMVAKCGAGLIKDELESPNEGALKIYRYVMNRNRGRNVFRTRAKRSPPSIGLLALLEPRFSRTARRIYPEY